jgi:putative SOS response-associated peptidase YedK
MCGRFTLGVEPVELQEAFDLSEAPVDWVLRENIAPTQPVAVLAFADNRKIEYMRWGLVPSWAKDISIGNKLFNARAETIQEKPSFRTAFARRRCLIPADGFYEWQKKEKGPSKPYRFQFLEKKPFAIAGLWELWRSPEGDELKSCTLITTEANSLVAAVHPRMPVILSSEECWQWIEGSDPASLQAMLKPFPAERMASFSVGQMPKDAI